MQIALIMKGSIRNLINMGITTKEFDKIEREFRKDEDKIRKDMNKILTGTSWFTDNRGQYV